MFQCNFLDSTEELSAAEIRFRSLEKAGPRYMWLILVANAAIILIAILIGTTFCRKGGSYGPYNMLPGKSNKCSVAIMRD